MGRRWKPGSNCPSRPNCILEPSRQTRPTHNPLKLWQRSWRETKKKKNKNKKTDRQTDRQAGRQAGPTAWPLRGAHDQAPEKNGAWWQEKKQHRPRGVDTSTPRQDDKAGPNLRRGASWRDLGGTSASCNKASVGQFDVLSEKRQQPRDLHISAHQRPVSRAHASILPGRASILEKRLHITCQDLYIERGTSILEDCLHITVWAFTLLVVLDRLVTWARA